MNIAYIADAGCNHGCKWINHFAQFNTVILICEENQKNNNLYIGNSNVKLVPILPRTFPLNPRKKRETVEKIKTVLTENNIDLLHSMYVVPYAFWGHASGFKNHIITTRGSDVLVDYKKYQTFFSLKDPRKTIIKFSLRKIFENTIKSARFVTCTSYKQAARIQHLVQNGNIKVIRTGVKVNDFIPYYSPKIENTTHKIVFSNRAMKPLYNIDKIILAIHKLNTTNYKQNPIKLITISYATNNDYLKKIQSLIVEKSMSDCIEIINSVTVKELVDWYNVCDAVIMIPSSDGTPVSGIESMLMKKPLIINNTLQYDNDLFNNDTVWGINDLSVDSIAEKLREVLTLTHKESESKLEKAYNAALTYANFDLEIKKTQTIYTNIIRSTVNSNIPSYKTCTKCVLDTTDDPKIVFDENGICNYCMGYEMLKINRILLSPSEKKERLDSVLLEIKKNTPKNAKYDCIAGISGGVDSSYLLYKAKELGLNPLVLHYDNGWNSEIAASNIENLVTKLQLDLNTYVNNWDEFKDLQLSFFKASVIDIELLTDQAISAILVNTARKLNIKYILIGTNNETEAILPENWYHSKADTLNIESIHKQFGSVPLKTYPILGFWRKWYYDKFEKIKFIPLLEYIDYDKDKAKTIITNELGWKDYGGKHYESVFTKFFQSYYLPKKFNADKRKAHLSTLICSGRITREEALEELKKPPYDPIKVEEDITYVIKKLGLSREEFDAIMKQPIKQHLDYPSYYNKHYKYQKLVSTIFRKIIGKL